VFVPGKPIQPSVMFASKAEWNTRKELHSGRLLPWERKIRMKRLARDKRSSLFRPFVGFEIYKSFLNMDLGAKVVCSF